MYLRSDVPALAFMNAQIAQLAVHTQDFAKCMDQVVRGHYGLTEYRFINPAYAMSLMYCLIVVPKEMWSLSENHQVYKDLAQLDPVQLFDIRIKPSRFDSHPVYYLVRHLRNSIAHANFELTASDGFIFWEAKAGPRHFEARASDESLALFLSRVGGCLANLGLSNRST